MILLYALHGFLGSHEDWSFLSPSHQHLIPIDLILSPFMPVEQDLNHVSHMFNAHISQSHPQNILLGYSLGARIAMHALIQAPHLWRAAILVSGHPGLDSEKEREAKWLED